MTNIKRFFASLLAGGILLTTAACGDGTTPSNPDGSTTTEGSTTATTTAPTGGTAPVLPTIEGDNPLKDDIYIVDTSTLPFDTSPKTPVSADFEVGKYYTGPKIAFRQSDDDTASFGMWLWDTRVIVGKDPSTELNADLLLDMMVQNRVTELYIHLGKLVDLETIVSDGGKLLNEDGVSEMVLRGFIKSCYQYGIRVEALVDGAGADAARYFGCDGDTAYNRMKTYLAFVASFNSRAADESERIYGIQFDVEPDWDAYDGREANVQHVANFFTYTRKLFDLYNVEVDFCVNAWINEDDKVIDETGAQVCLLDVLTKKCHSLTLMAYRPAADAQFDASKLELEYGKKNGCHVVVGSETISSLDLAPSERTITYWRIGCKKMSKEQTALRQMLADAGYDNAGGAIHHAHAFYTMTKDRK